MSKVLPFGSHVKNSFNDDEEEAVCPRYEKWIERYGTDDPLLRRRLKGRINLNPPGAAAAPIRHPHPHRRSNKKLTIKNKSKLQQQQKSNRPLRSRSIFKKIRQKGRNFGIRCKTSVDLWRKWIKRGIGWGQDSPNTQYPDTCENQAPETKDYARKNLLNEVIPEENEFIDSSSDSGSYLEEVEEARKGGRQQSAQDKSSGMAEVKHHHHVGGKGGGKSSTETGEKSKGTDAMLTSNGERKYSKKELESVDTNKIESVQEDGDQKTENAETQAATKPKNKLRKAFKKILIFF